VKNTASPLVPLIKGESESRGIPTFYSATNELDEKNYVLDKIKELTSSVIASDSEAIQET
jgi:hypothetical protein